METEALQALVDEGWRREQRGGPRAGSKPAARCSGAQRVPDPERPEQGARGLGGLGEETVRG